MILVGKTNKGKNVVQRDGSGWRMVRAQSSVACFDGRPGMFIEPMAGDVNRASRWIEFPVDPNFEVRS